MHDTAPPARGARHLVPALPALAAAAIFAPSTANGFAYDDVQAIVQNPLLQHLPTLPSALAQAYWLTQGHLYRPLSILSWGLEWQASGGEPWLFHLLNVLWHAAASALVARLAARWLPSLGALAAGLAFAVHPVHAEAVANAVGRSELVAAAMLAALGLVVTGGPLAPGRDRLARAALLSALALASKEVGVIAPAVAFGLAWARPDAPGRADLARRYGLAALAGVVPLLLARFAVLGTFGGDRSHHAFDAVGGVGEALVVLGAVPAAAARLLAPLVPRIEWAPSLAALQAPSVPSAALGLGIVLLVAAVLLRHLRRPTVWTTAVWLAAAALAPTSNLVFRSGVVLAERTLYTPSVGACLLLGAAVSWALARGRLARGVAAAGAAAWLAAALLVTPRENAVWKDNDRLSATMLERAPDSYRSHMFRASILRGHGRHAEARAHFRHAVALFPYDAGLLVDAATAEQRSGDRARAERLLARAVAVEPARRGARTLLARMRLARGDGAAALPLLEDGLRREPDQRLWRRWADSLRAAGVRSPGRGKGGPGS